MPRRGVPNNPGGANGATDPTTGETSAAGLIRRDMQTTGLGSAPGENAPTRDKKAAVRQQTPAPPAPAAPAGPSSVTLFAPPAQPEPLTYEQQLSGVWSQIASTPGASLLVQSIAEQSQNG